MAATTVDNAKPVAGPSYRLRTVWWLGYLPNNLANSPRPAGCSCPWQRRDFGTLAMTESTCWPQPAHVVFPQILQFT